MHHDDRIPRPAAHRRAGTRTPPPPLRERRSSVSRRAEDQVAAQEASLLARSLDILADGRPGRGPPRRPPGPARTDGRGPLRRRSSRTARRGGSPSGSAATTTRPRPWRSAAWLDGAAPRTRRRASRRGAPRPIAVAVGAASRVAATAPLGRPRATPRSPSPTVGPASRSGFAFADAADAGRRSASACRRTLARHAAVALALVTERTGGGARTGRPPGAGSRTRHVRIDGRPRAADPADRTGRVPRPHPRRRGRRSGRPARVHGARSRDRRRRSPTWSGTCSSCPASSPGTMTIDRRSFSLAEALDATSRTAWTRSPWTAASRSGPTLPPRLRAATGDRRRVEQIVRNLAANGLKFAPGRIVARSWPAGSTGSVASSRSATRGTGSSADDRARIFERFYRMAGHDRITGTGLGLPDRTRPGPGDGRRPRRRQRARMPAPRSSWRCPARRRWHRTSSPRRSNASASPKRSRSRNGPSCTRCDGAPDGRGSDGLGHERG